MSTNATNAEELAICYHPAHCGATASTPCGIAKYRKTTARKATR